MSSFIGSFWDYPLTTSLVPCSTGHSLPYEILFLMAESGNETNIVFFLSLFIIEDRKTGIYIYNVVFCLSVKIWCGVQT